MLGLALRAIMREFLEFPVATLGGVVLELFGRAEEGPLEFGGGEVDAALVGVGVVGVQAVGAGTNNAPVNDERFEVESWKFPTGRDACATAKAVLEMFQDFKLVAGEGGFPKPSGKKRNEKMGLLRPRWGAGDDAHRAAWMHERVVRPAHFERARRSGVPADMFSG